MLVRYLSVGKHSRKFLSLTPISDEGSSPASMRTKTRLLRTLLSASWLTTALSTAVLDNRHDIFSMRPRHHSGARRAVDQPSPAKAGHSGGRCDHDHVRVQSLGIA